jgi:hypothetical protein
VPVWTNTTSDALSNIFLTDSLVRFAEIAGKPEFHQSVHRAFSDLANAYILEASGRVPYLSPEEMFRAVADRAAPFHILVAAMAYRSGLVAKMAECSRMVCHFILWYQLLDDATDWRADLAKRRQTYLLHRLSPWMEGVPFSDWTPEQVGDALSLYGGAESMIPECIAHLNAALEIALEHACPEARDESNPASLVRWVRMFIEVHHQALADSLERKRAFLAAAGR